VDDKSRQRVSESARRRDGRRAANAVEGAAGRETVLDESANREHHERRRAARHRDPASQFANDVPAILRPTFIWGPPLYYPYASWYYPGDYFGFGVGIPMDYILAVDGRLGRMGWGFGWGGHSIFVNNSFIHRYNFNSRGSASLSGRSTWAHDASHRGGVPYSNAAWPTVIEATCARICKLVDRRDRRKLEAPPNPEASEWAIGRFRRVIPAKTVALSAEFGRAKRRGAERPWIFQPRGRPECGGGFSRGGGGGGMRGGGGGMRGGGGGGGHR